MAQPSMRLFNRVQEPFRVAVIGAGPAGFYTSHRLLSKLPDVRIEMYEALPVPYGLVRYGVAPDHPEVKNCQQKFEEVAESNRFKYIGNIPIGSKWNSTSTYSLPLSVLAPHYDALLFSYGASRDRLLSIPGEQSLEGVYSARAFVGWYNGLPEYRNLNPKLDGEQVVVIGQGNVAFDVARILLSDVRILRHTDITEYALDALSRSRIRSVVIIGRRGPLEVSFTTRELRELLSLKDVGFEPVDQSIINNIGLPTSRQSRKILDLLQNGSETSYLEAKRSWRLKFLRAPISFLPSNSDTRRVGAVRCEKTRLDNSTANGTGEFEVVQANTVFRSIGYLSEPITGLEDQGIPFDTVRGLIPNENGRVVKNIKSENCEEDHNRGIAGVYTSGWLKTGPRGVIASTMYDAFITADNMVSDWTSGTRKFMNEGKKTEGWEAVRLEVQRRGLAPVNWEQWKLIDSAERQHGKMYGKQREKFTSVDAMLASIK